MLNEDEFRRYLQNNHRAIISITEEDIKTIGKMFLAVCQNKIEKVRNDSRYPDMISKMNLIYSFLPETKSDIIQFCVEGIDEEFFKALNYIPNNTISEWIMKHIAVPIKKYKSKEGNIEAEEKERDEVDNMGINQPVEQKTESNQCKDSEIPKPVIEEDGDTRSKRIANNIYQQIGSILDKSYEMSISQGENPAVILRIIDYPVLNQLVTKYNIKVPDCISKKNKYDIVNFIKLIKKTLKANYPDVYKHFTDISKEKRNERRQTTPDDWYLTIVNNTQFQSMSPTEKLVILDLVHHIHIMKTLESPKLKTGFTYRPTYECNIDVGDRTKFGKTMKLACDMGLIKEIKRKDKTGEEISSKGLPKLFVIP